MWSPPSPSAAAIDASGNPYVGWADIIVTSNLNSNPHYQGKIVKRASDGTVTDFVTTDAFMNHAGGFNATYIANDKMGTTPSPTGGAYGLATGPRGLYISFLNNVSVADLTTGALPVLAGATGSAGFGDGATGDARFDRPMHMAVDADGTVWVPDFNNRRICKIGTDGIVSTVAGGTAATDSVDGTGTAASFLYPTAVAWTGDTLYVADGSCIRKLAAATGVVTTFAGKCNDYLSGKNAFGTDNYADGTGTVARFQGIAALQLDPAGNLIVLDSGMVVPADHGIGHGTKVGVRKITPAGKVTTILDGVGRGIANGTGEAASLGGMSGLAYDAITGDWAMTEFNLPYESIRKLVP